MKKIIETLKIQVKGPLQTSKIIWNQHDVKVENDIEDLKEILDRIKNKTIKFKQNDGFKVNIPRNELTTCEDTQKDGTKRRGRPPKASTMFSDSKVGRSDSSDSMSLEDSSASTSSSRSRRAAAQAAGHKLARVNSLVQLNTKLRRPTNFDEKQAKAVSSPPAKCRRTQRNQSAGSSSSQTDEIESGATNKDILNTDHVAIVSIEKLNTPTIESYTQPHTRSSRRLDRVSRGKSGDLFNESNSRPELNVKPNASNSNPQNLKENKSNSKTCLNSGISSTEDLQLMEANLPIAQSSPIAVEPFDGKFKGFDDQLEDNRTNLSTAILKDNTFVVKVQSEDSQFVSKTFKPENQELKENTIKKIKTKTLKNRETHTVVNVDEKENLNRNNETHVIANKPDVSPNLRSRTKVLKKTADKNVEGDEKNSDEDSESISSPEIKTNTRTKTIKTHNEQVPDLKSDSVISGQSARSRTKTLKKKNEKEDQSDSTDNEASSLKSRTKTIKKGTRDIKNNELDSEYLISEFKDNALSNKNNRLCPISPAPAKGELVKKRIEDFEKMQNGSEESEEERATGRVTRNAMKSKGIPTTDAISSKQSRIAVAKLQAGSTMPPMSSERVRMTPLGVNNRLTPGLGSAHKLQTNKALGSSNRPIPVETNSLTLIHKQATEEAEKKRKEVERLKRQAKEEDAKRKKEKALKATAEETRRKRIEKLQKVAATREAAEKEKERLAAKAEKEKEEKMQQIAIEKERQKEEQLKKKQLQQQKSQEHEERRKQEEAARVAKLKEQEEEHKRQQAMRERELELQKQHKAELRLAEAEKLKLQGGKLGKIAAVNNAKLKLQHGTTPSEKTNSAQSSNCYEITPAREDRPLLPPKTENDYGIDDANSGDSSEDESQPKKMIPLWAQSKNREQLLMVNKYIPKKLWDLFMECDPCPDINKMFAGNPIKKRIRTSSAVWRTPPKYSRVAP